MIAIIDYDAGNVKSVEKALAFLGEEAVLTRDSEKILSSDRVIFPGVGNFGDAMEKLHRYGLAEAIREVVHRQIPLLGICLGLQLFFEESEEAPGVKGLGIFPGKVRRFPGGDGLKIPHMGWNSLELLHEGRLFRDIPDQSFVYFVHSYYVPFPENKIADEIITNDFNKNDLNNDSFVKASCQYGIHFAASVERGNVFGCQFHPEKSSSTGLKILSNFITV